MTKRLELSNEFRKQRFSITKKETNDAGIACSNYYQKHNTSSYGTIHRLWNDSKLLYTTSFTSFTKTKLIINGNYPSFRGNTNSNKYSVNSFAWLELTI